MNNELQALKSTCDRPPVPATNVPVGEMKSHAVWIEQSLSALFSAKFFVILMPVIAIMIKFEHHMGIFLKGSK